MSTLATINSASAETSLGPAEAKFASLSPSVLDELRAIVGADQLLVGSEIPHRFYFDAGTKGGASYPPAALVLPADADQVAAVLRLANHHRVPVTPRGGGSGLAGGAVALHGGIILDLARLNQIIAFNEQLGYVELQPGVRTLDLQNAAKARGLLYAGDPCSSDDCVIGGNIATNAGGNRAVKYGVTSDQVLELEIVTATGERTVLGGRLKKNSTGYSLVRLISGSEGTLAVITRAVLRLYPLAPLLPDYLVDLPGLVPAMSLVQALVADPEVDPITLEIINHDTVVAMERLAGRPIFGAPSGDILMVQFEAFRPKEAWRKAAILKRLCRRHHCLSVKPAADSAAVWTARRTWGKAIQEETPVSVGEDLVVPVDQLATFIQGMEGLLASYGLGVRLAGHAGDGNMHITTIPGSVSLDDWPSTQTAYRHELYQLVYGLGGRLSGEHGIGIKRKANLAGLIDPVELSLMRQIKQAFDPNGILNPGKIFDPA